MEISMNKLKYKNIYKTENELCNIFIVYAKNNNWKVFPETSNFDILIVKNNFQIGIQAKLIPNIEVLDQAIAGRQSDNINIKWANPSPHIRAVLVPHASREFKNIANALGVFVIEGMKQIRDIMAGQKYWIKEISGLDGYSKKHLTYPAKLCWTPEVEIDTPAGVKSPKIITQWKIKAVKLCLLLEAKGYLTIKDFKEAKVSSTLWIKKRWLIDSGDKEGGLKKYIRTNIILPHEKYPEITEKLK